MSTTLYKNLLTEKRFAPYFYAQALGGLNDNVLKNALAVLIALQASQLWGLNRDQLINLSAALFILPFFLFSPIAGQWADKYEKSRQIRLLKGFELLIMLIAALGWWWQSLPILLTALFLMGLQTAIFSPIKYALLPQALPREQLMAGNGLSEAGSFVAILMGTGLGPSLMALDHQPTLWVAGICLAVAVLGYWISRAIPQLPAVTPDQPLNWNPFSEGWQMLRLARRTPSVLLSMLALSWFWYFGATYLVQIPSFTINVLGVSPLATGVMMGIFIIGISVGSLACHRLTAGRIETGLVAVGGVGMTLFGVDFYLATPATPLGQDLAVLPFLSLPGTWRLFADMIMMGLCGGFFVVPLYALLQDRSPPRQRARLMAANSMLNAFYMVAASVIAMVLLGLGLNIRQLLLYTAVANLIMLLALLRWMPGIIASVLHQLLSRLCYRPLRRDLRRLPPSSDIVLLGGHGWPLLVSLQELGSDRCQALAAAPSGLLERLLRGVFRPADQAPAADDHGRRVYWLTEYDQRDRLPQSSRDYAWYEVKRNRLKPLPDPARPEQTPAPPN
ncbi:MAG: hypothetical protein Tsb002_28940 [Wenzhouxiangellaceae bacterium]